MIKKSGIFSIALLILITACNQGSPQYSTGEACNDIGCASISIEHPIQAMKPVQVTISFQLTQINDDLHIFFLSENLQSFQFDLAPEATEEWRTDINAGWEIVNPELNKEYIFKGIIVLNEPNLKPNLSYYGIGVLAGFTQGMPMHAEVKIYLDGDGKMANTTPTIEPSIIYILPEPPNNITVVPEAPYPTFPPTFTPYTTSTPTYKAYPAPETVGTADAYPVITATLPGYPVP
jgi:hypothetical protein